MIGAGLHTDAGQEAHRLLEDHETSSTLLKAPERGGRQQGWGGVVGGAFRCRSSSISCNKSIHSFIHTLILTAN